MLFILVFISLFFALTLYSKSIGLGLMLFVFMLHGSLVEEFGSSAIHLPIEMASLLVLCIFMKGYWKGVDKNMLFLFFSLAVIMLACASFSAYPKIAFKSFFLYVKGMGLAVIVAGCIHKRKELIACANFCLAATVTGVLISIVNMATSKVLMSGDLARSSSLREDPNDTAMLLGTGVSLAIFSLNKHHNFYTRMVGYISCPMLILGVILTGSRGGFLMLGLISVSYMVVAPSFKKVILSASILSCVLIFAPPQYTKRLSSIFTGSEKKSQSLNRRKMFVQIGVDSIQDNPLLGVGAGHYGKSVRDYINEDKSGTGVRLGDTNSRFVVAHNMYVEFFVENGILGGFLFLGILSTPLFRLYHYSKSIEKADPIESGIGFSLMLSLMAMYSSCIFLSQGKNSVLWFIIGLGFSATIHLSSENEVSTDDNKVSLV